MDKIKVTEIQAYTWGCPNCGYYNCQDKYAQTICDGCSLEFEIEEVEQG